MGRPGGGAERSTAPGRLRLGVAALLADADGRRHRTPLGGEPPRAEAATLASHHPGLDVVGERVSGPPVDVLLPVADDSETLVLGSRALGGLHGFVIGSVAQSVVAHAKLPVVLVRAPEKSAGSDADGPDTAAEERVEETGEVLVGVALAHPDDDLLAPAFLAAERRGVRLHVLHCGRPEHGSAGNARGEGSDGAHGHEDARLAEALAPWRRAHPEVEVVAETCAGRPAERLVHASEDASLLVVGRRLPPPHAVGAAHRPRHARRDAPRAGARPGGPAGLRGPGPARLSRSQVHPPYCPPWSSAPVPTPRPCTPPASTRPPSPASPCRRPPRRRRTATATAPRRRGRRTPAKPPASTPNWPTRPRRRAVTPRPRTPPRPGPDRRRRGRRRRGRGRRPGRRTTGHPPPTTAATCRTRKAPRPPEHREGPVFEVSDRRASILVNAEGVTFRLDDEVAEFGWDEIGAVEIDTPRFGRRFTVTVYTGPRRWYEGEVEAPGRSHLKQWAADLDAALDAWFDDGATDGGEGADDITDTSTDAATESDADADAESAADDAGSAVAGKPTGAKAEAEVTAETEAEAEAVATEATESDDDQPATDAGTAEADTGRVAKVSAGPSSRSGGGSPKRPCGDRRVLLGTARPTSSQTGMLMGLMRGGPFGAFLAWLGFTAPSALAMTSSGAVLGGARLRPDRRLVQRAAGRALAAAAAVVAQAVLGLAGSLCTDLPTKTIALAGDVP